jgi:hypothetical protein
VRDAPAALRAGDLFRDDDVAGSLEELNAEVDRTGAPTNPHPCVQSRAAHARRPFHDEPPTMYEARRSFFQAPADRVSSLCASIEPGDAHRPARSALDHQQRRSVGGQ